MSHVRRPRHHRASTRRLAGARPDGVHRGWIHPLHDRAVDVFRPLLTPVHWGVFVTAATPWKCARTLRFRPAQSIPRRPSGPGSFWPYTPLHPLKKPGLNGHFSLFAIWPYFFSFRPYFRSCFGPRLCKCTNLDHAPESANLPGTSLSGRPPRGVDPVLPRAVCRPCHRSVGRCMGVDRPGVRL